MNNSGIRRHRGPRLLLASIAGVSGLLAISVQAAPTMRDPNLQVSTVTTGISAATSMAFTGPDEFLILEKASGKVKRVVNGLVSATVLDLPVNSNSERGLLGITLDTNFAGNGFVYLSWVESSSGADSTVVGEVGNPSSAFAPGTNPPRALRVDRFVWNGANQTLTFQNNLIRLRTAQNDKNNAQSPATITPQGNSNGGKLATGADGRIYVFVGDVGRRGWMQNLPNGPFLPGTLDDEFGGPATDNNHLSGVILRLNTDGSAPADNPFFAAGAALGGEVGANLQKIFSYGHRNSFGMAFDSATGQLWMSDNGDDSFDEINRVSPGGNYGWVQAMGPVSRIAQFKSIEMNMFNTATASVGSLQQLRYPTSRIAYNASTALSRLLMLPGASYQDPELSWRYGVPSSGLAVMNSTTLGAGYAQTLWIGEARTTNITGGATGTFAGGALMMMRLSADHQHLDLSSDPRLADRVADNGTYPVPLGTNPAAPGFKFDGKESEGLLVGDGFGVITDIQVSPRGTLYVVSNSDNAVYEINRAP